MEAYAAEDKNEYKQDQKEGKQEARDSGKSTRETRKPEEAEDQSSNGTNDRPIQHSKLEAW